MRPNFDNLSVMILAGGISHERDISLRSGRRLADSLSARGHTVTLRDPDSSLLSFLAENRPDVIWPALHGSTGEDGSLSALIELSGIPCVGSRTDATRLAWSKPTAKTVVARAGVRTPASVTLPQSAFRELGAGSVLDAVLTGLGTPLVVKPSHGGSAQGVSVGCTNSDLPRAMVDAYTYSDVALIEQEVSGVEVAVGIIDTGDGPVALPAVEIEPVRGRYGYAARYNAGETRFYTPARVPADVADAIARAAVTAHTALGIRHLSRIDLIVDENGTPWFLEANALPGLTETSLFPQAIVAAGLDQGAVYADLALAAIRDAG
ncbi:MAG: D-alanine--D-alanine ligase [Microbacteriaceae bacterium]